MPLRGGAIYGHFAGEHDLISTQYCIIKYSDLYSSPTEWNVTFHFEDNRAENEINSIYVTSTLPCLWGGSFGTTLEQTRDVFCWNDENTTRWNYSTGNCSENIATSPARFTPRLALDRTNLSNSSISSKYHLNMIPGKREALPFLTVGDQGFDITKDAIFIAQVDNDSMSSLFLDNSSVYIADNRIQVHGAVNAMGTLKIEMVDPRVVSTRVSVTILDCPPGMFLNNSICVCGFGFNGLVDCYQNNYTTQLQRGAWIGKVEGLVLVGVCPYCSRINSLRYLNLPTDPRNLEEKVCGKIYREGILCGKCKSNYGPAVNSEVFQCMNCFSSNGKAQMNWIYYLLTDFLPIAIFFLIVVIFNIGVTSGPANAFIFFAQMINTAIVLDGDGYINVDDVLSNGTQVNNILWVIPFGIWNLDFFRPYLPKFCLSANITTLQLLAIGYIAAFFPLALVIVFFFFSSLHECGCNPVAFLCRPLKRFYGALKKGTKVDFQQSILHAFATFILLSYTKITQVSFFLLTSTPLLESNGKLQSYRLYYDGTIEFGSWEHFPYLLLSIFVLLTFVAIPPIVLIVPSMKHLLYKYCSSSKCQCQCETPSCCCFRSKGQKLDHFLKAFYGCYKDGTGGDDGKIDYQWFAGLYFILRIVMLALYAFTFDWVDMIVFQQIVCTAALAAFVILRPYKNDLYNKVDAAFFGLLVALCSLSLQNHYSSVVRTKLSVWTFIAQYTLLTIPLIYISIVVIVLFLQKVCKCKTKAIDENEILEFADLRQAELEINPRPVKIASLKDDTAQPLLLNEELPSLESTNSNKDYDKQNDTDQNPSQCGSAHTTSEIHLPMLESSCHEEHDSEEN